MLLNLSATADRMTHKCMLGCKSLALHSAVGTHLGMAMTHVGNIVAAIKVLVSIIVI